MCDKAVY